MLRLDESRVGRSDGRGLCAEGCLASGLEGARGLLQVVLEVLLVPVGDKRVGFAENHGL